MDEVPRLLELPPRPRLEPVFRPEDFFAEERLEDPARLDELPLRPDEDFFEPARPEELPPDERPVVRFELPLPEDVPVRPALLAEPPRADADLEEDFFEADLELDFDPADFDPEDFELDLDPEDLEPDDFAPEDFEPDFADVFFAADLEPEREDADFEADREPDLEPEREPDEPDLDPPLDFEEPDFASSG